ncbi:MAG TPA: DUF1127 domain-containing protein [Dongiaceae bacterium]|nr:DUF1127 domain-containing protein [Dongiaceae bacterium]
MALVHDGKHVVGSSAWTPGRLLRWLIGRLRTWRRTAAEQRHLAGLNDYNLKDLGLTRRDVDRDVLCRDQD